MKKLINFTLIFYFDISLFFLCITVLPVYAASGDDNIKANVERAITSRYDPADIQVAVKDNGEVILQGDVNSLYDKYRIYEITSRVVGVKKIDNNITVDTDMLPSKMIEADIQNVLSNSNEIKEPQKINVDVTGSVARLSGNVNYYREKVVAMTLASQVDGVTDIKDDITVTPIGKAVDDGDIKDYLNSIILNEFPLLNPQNISISVSDGFVTIEGAVPNIWTKDKIEEEFKSVAGVVRVINNLEVNPSLPNS
jgi:osmotically-inducible protein OsmY